MRIRTWMVVIVALATILSLSASNLGEGMKKKHEAKLEELSLSSTKVTYRTYVVGYATLYEFKLADGTKCVVLQDPAGSVTCNWRI